MLQRLFGHIGISPFKSISICISDHNLKHHGFGGFLYPSGQRCHIAFDNFSNHLILRYPTGITTGSSQVNDSSPFQKSFQHPRNVVVTAGCILIFQGAENGVCQQKYLYFFFRFCQRQRQTEPIIRSFIPVRSFIQDNRYHMFSLSSQFSLFPC